MTVLPRCLRTGPTQNLGLARNAPNDAIRRNLYVFLQIEKIAATARMQVPKSNTTPTTVPPVAGATTCRSVPSIDGFATFSRRAELNFSLAFNVASGLASTTAVAVPPATTALFLQKKLMTRSPSPPLFKAATVTFFGVLLSINACAPKLVAVLAATSFTVTVLLALVRSTFPTEALAAVLTVELAVRLIAYVPAFLTAARPMAFTNSDHTPACDCTGCNTAKAHIVTIKHLFIVHLQKTRN